MWELAAASLHGFRSTLDADGFIEHHVEVIACLREVVAGMVAAIHERAGRAVELFPRDLHRLAP